MRWTPEELADYMNKHNAPAWVVPKWAMPDDEGKESVLAGKIQQWARDKGYPCQSNRQTKRAKGLLTPGWPDVTLILSGRVLFLELKVKGGRMSEEQKQLALQFSILGTPIHRVTSFKGFLEIVGII
jgi:hypothetical protein